ncbi:MAG: hypothetical protein KM310_01520 [Clostridiales bacterium]|nr:hypothetical protein [Clostridiales bacterium]
MAFWTKDDGQGTVEYGFILMVVAFLVLAGFSLLGEGVSSFFHHLSSLLRSLI